MKFKASNCNCLNEGICKEKKKGKIDCICKKYFYGPKCEYKLAESDCYNGDINKPLCFIWSLLGFCSSTYGFNRFPIHTYCPISCGLCK